MESELRTHIRLRRSWRSVLPEMLLAFAMALLILWLSIKYDSFGLPIPLGSLGLNYTLNLPLYMLVFVVFMARPLFLLYNARHEVGEHHVYSVQGIWSLKRDHVEIPFEDVLGVRYKQSLLERVLNVGNILVWTASAERPEIVMEGIGDPEEGMRLIRARLDETILADKHKSVRPQSLSEQSA